MKFILFSLNDEKSTYTIKHELDPNNHLNEISLSRNILDKRLNAKNSFWGKLSSKNIDKKMFKTIEKALEGNAEKWQYLMSKNLINEPKYVKYLSILLENALGYNISYTSELDKNFMLYLKDYCGSNEIKEHELKVLLVYKNYKNINLELINSIIDNCKNVNLYSDTKPSNGVLEEIKKLNNDNGTTVDFIKKEKKSLLDYDAIYFADDVKTNFPRLRMSKKALIIDKSLAFGDKYNSNIIYVENYMLRDDINKEDIISLFEYFGKFEIACVLNKITNNY